jgi:hypothetical protein
MTDDFSRARIPLTTKYEDRSGDEDDSCDDDSDDDEALSWSLGTRSSFSHSC